MSVAELHPSNAALEAFSLGTLEDALASALEIHLADCPACQDRAANASCDGLVELLRRVHAQSASAVDTVALPGDCGQTPNPATPECPPMRNTVPPELSGHERYRIVRLLGQGGMGAVYEAEHAVMRRSVALKVINRAFTANPDAVERFHREARAAARLSHPNIVTAYDADSVGETHFLVMEYVQGVNLARLVKQRGPLPVAEACEYVRQAALGLQHAHERGMVHRDVKPDNLIRDADGQVKVLDFGLAALTAEQGSGLTEANVVMGTPDYMAPEQAENVHTADIRADVYSLGCTLHYLLTGRAPYAADTAMRKLLAHRDQPVPSLHTARPEAPAELTAVLARLLAKNPRHRYQTPGEVAVALEPFARSVAVKPAGTRWGLFVAMAAALLVGSALAGAAGYFYWAATYRVQTDTGEIIIQTDDPDVEVVMKRGGQLVRIIDPTSKQTWELDTTKYQIGMADQPDGLKIDLPGKEPLVLKRGNTGIVRVSRDTKASVKADDPKEVPLTAPKTLEIVRTFSWPNRTPGTSFSEDGTLLVGVGRNDFRVWEVDSGKVVRDFADLPHLVTVRFMAGGKQLLSSHHDGTFRHWELATGKLLGQLQGPVGWNQIGGITPDGTRFCFYGDQGVFVYDLGKRKELLHVGPLKDQSILLASHALSPNGKLVAMVDHCRPEGETVVRLFNVDTGKLVRSIPSKFWPDNLSWSEDSRQVFLNAGDAEVRGSIIAGWHVETGELVSKVRLVPDIGTFTYGRYFSRDGRYFAVEYPDKKLIHLYDARSGQLIGRAEAPLAWFGLSFSPNGREAACGSQGEVILYRLPPLAAPKDKP